jgi:hypothetical protein
MEKKLGFLKEEDGTFSSTRLVFVIGSVWNMTLCSYLVFDGIEAGALVATFSALQGVFVGLKLGQKPMENKK